MCLAVIAIDRSGADVTVHNKGVAGENTAQALTRLHADVFALKPTYVLIYYGTNDTLNELRFVAPLQFEENLTSMVSQSKARGIVPVLCTIHHCVPSKLFMRHRESVYGKEGPNGKIDHYNDLIRSVATREDILLADFAVVTGELSPEGNWIGPDGVHLTWVGYQKLAQTFFAALKGKIKDHDTIVCFGDSLTFGVGVLGSGSAEGKTYPAYLKTLLTESSASNP